MDFDFRQLEIFCHVVEQRSFTRAARAVHLSQASVSERIASLERTVGVRLLDRLGREVVPTAVGRRLFAGATALLDGRRELQRDLEGLTGIERGALELGASTIPGEYLLPATIARFRQRYPDVVFRVAIAATDGIIDRVARANDVRAGDLDGDGDADLAVAQFGYDDGEMRWMENKGNWQFESHMLLQLSGAIHMPIVDIDQDGDLDMVALVSQEWEEIYVFENDGKANFTTKAIYGSTNEDFGSSGLSVADLDQDGDPDLLYTNGDAFDYLPPGPRPWHGVQWLENKGNLEFTFHRIADYPGAYSARELDVDGDGDLDVFAVSAFHEWRKADAHSFMWYENDGQMNFIERAIATAPTHILALEIADMDQDGDADFVTGGMHAYPPYDRMARIMLWTNQWFQQSSSRTE